MIRPGSMNSDNLPSSKLCNDNHERPYTLTQRQGHTLGRQHVNCISCLEGQSRSPEQKLQAQPSCTITPEWIIALVKSDHSRLSIPVLAQTVLLTRSSANLYQSSDSAVNNRIERKSPSLLNNCPIMINYQAVVMFLCSVGIDALIAAGWRLLLRFGNS